MCVCTRMGAQSRTHTLARMHTDSQSLIMDTFTKPYTIVYATSPNTLQVHQRTYYVAIASVTHNHTHEDIGVFHAPRPYSIPSAQHTTP